MIDSGDGVKQVTNLADNRNRRRLVLKEKEGAYERGTHVFGCAL